VKQKERLWEEYKRLIREERYAEAKQAYRKYLKATDPKPLWRANFTTKWFKHYPRTMVPFLLNFPDFRKFQRKLVTEMEEARRTFGETVPSPSKVGEIAPSREGITVLNASSDYEGVTRMGALWIDTTLVPEVQRLGYNLRNLRDPLAQRPLYELLLESDFSFGVGHGSATTFTGGLQQPLLTSEERGHYRKEAVEGGAFKYLSCLLGKELLPDLVKNGDALLCQGYRKTYSFMNDPRFFVKPENDATLALFFEGYSESVKALLNGATNEEACELERNVYLRNSRRTTDPEIRDLLLREAAILDFWGDSNARIVE